MKAQRRTIAVVTGSRADFGLLRPVMDAISDRGGLGVGGPQPLRLVTIVTGSHLTLGTWRDVPDAGLQIDQKVPMQRRLAVGRPADVAALGRGIAGLGKAFSEVRPALVLVLGDRIEALAAACAASVGGIRLAHIHGGDRAAGVADEAMRHAISKMAHLHFAATAQSRRRLIRMGEVSSRVYRVGSPAVDGLRAVKPAKDGPALIVIQHPVGESDDQECCWMQQTLQATTGYDRLVMAPNGDPGSCGIRRALHQRGLKAVEHLSRPRFLSLLAGARAIVGNSSAGLIEAAVLGRACVNIGPRQAGRQRPASVIDCVYGHRAVGAAIKKAMRLQERGRVRHPYGDGQAGRRIADILATVDLSQIPIHKHNAY